MKTIKFIALAIFASFSVVYGQTTTPPVPSSLPMLTSKAALRSYAVEQTQVAYVSAYSPSQINSSQSSSSIGIGLPSGQDSADMLSYVDRIVSQNVSVTFVNKNDPANIDGTFADKFGNTMFYSYGSSTPQSGKLPTVYLAWYLESEIPISIPGAQSATVLVVGTNGMTQYPIPLNVSNGMVWFQTDDAGQGILSVTMNDGSVVSYNLMAQGTQVTPSTFAVNTYSYIDQLWSFSNSSFIDWEIYSNGGVGENPTFEVNQSVSTTMSVDVFTTEGAQSIGVYVRNKGDTVWNFYPAVNSITTIPVNAGTCYMVPAWNVTDFREPDPTPPWDAKG